MTYIKSKEIVDRHRKKWRESHIKKGSIDWLKMKARTIAFINIKEKLPCSVCGNVKAEKHHPDYSKPLEVIWLCKKHHIEAHYGKMVCKIDGCNRKTNARGMCDMHYHRWRRLPIDKKDL